MAQSRRIERVASLIKRQVSEILVSGIRDERVNHGIITITDIDLSGDLQHCKIFVSIYGSDDDQINVINGLHSATPFLRGELARRLQMRRAPEIVFQIDHGIKKGANVLNLLGKLEDQRNKKDKLIKDNE